MKTYGFVFARGGSKGLPGKNIRPLCGKPLIAWAIEAGLSCDRIDKMIVSTDSDEIADIARQYGAEVPFLRPKELAADHAAEVLSWRHAVRFLQERGDKFDIFVSLPATAPLRTVEDICRCMDAYFEGYCDLSVVCTEPYRSPYFNMLTLDDKGYAQIAVKVDGKTYVRRQDTPPVYDLTTVCYVTSPEFILSEKNAWNDNGRVKAVMTNKVNAIDSIMRRPLKLCAKDWMHCLTSHLMMFTPKSSLPGFLDMRHI